MYLERNGTASYLDGYLKSPLYLNIEAVNLGIVILGVLILILVMYLLKRTDAKMHTLVTPDPYALYNESYCVLTLNILRVVKWHLILNIVGNIAFIV